MTSSTPTPSTPLADASPAGASPAGTSPAGTSPAGSSPAGTSPAGGSPAVTSSDSSNTSSSSVPSSTSPTVQSTTPSPTTSSSSTVSTTSSSSHSHTSEKAATTVSTTASQSSASSASAHASPTNSSTGSHGLSNGAVAGIVIAVALGIALLTFLATFLLMRRRQQSRGKRRYPPSRDSGGFELNPSRQQDQTPISKKPFATATSGGPGTYENYLPQSADDKTVQQKVKAILDQVELHIENFYRNSSSSALKPDNADLAVFDSPYLPASLASLLPRSKNKLNIMKHALAQSVTSSISPSANPARSLLPPEYALLPNTVNKTRLSVSTKPGEYRFITGEYTNCEDAANTTKGLLRSCLDGVS